MTARPGRAVCTLAALATLILATGCARPSGNEINFSDEGRRDGAAAARNLTPVRLESFEIGRGVNDSQAITEEADRFQPHEPVFAAIHVSGSANSALVRTLWLGPDGRPVQDDTRIATPSRGEKITLKAQPTGGWKGGRYQVEVFLDDQLAESQTFTIVGGQQPGPNPQQGVEAPNRTKH